MSEAVLLKRDWYLMGKQLGLIMVLLEGSFLYIACVYEKVSKLALFIITVLFSYLVIVIRARAEEMGKGEHYLLACTYSRKQLVQGKYRSTLSIVGAFLLFSLIIDLVVECMKQENYSMIGIGSICGISCVVIGVVTLLFHLYEYSKAQSICFFFIFGGNTLIYILAELLKGKEDSFLRLMNYLFYIDFGAMIVGVIVLVISTKITSILYEKKDF